MEFDPDGNPYRHNDEQSEAAKYHLTKDNGAVIIDAVIRANAIESAIIEDNGTIFVWSANASEQIEAALLEAGYRVVPIDPSSNTNPGSLDPSSQ